MDFNIKTSKKHEVIDITAKINEIVNKSGVKKGICNIFVMHTTMALTINENKDSKVDADLLKNMERLFPKDSNYLHNQIDNNAEAHLKAAVIGPSETIPIENGKLKLGTYQTLMACEFDGPRERIINVEIIKG